jgi:hypothetical protein
LEQLVEAMRFTDREAALVRASNSFRTRKTYPSVFADSTALEYARIPKGSVPFHVNLNLFSRIRLDGPEELVDTIDVWKRAYERICIARDEIEAQILSKLEPFGGNLKTCSVIFLRAGRIPSATHHERQAT